MNQHGRAAVAMVMAGGWALAASAARAQTSQQAPPAETVTTPPDAVPTEAIPDPPPAPPMDEYGDNAADANGNGAVTGEDDAGNGNGNGDAAAANGTSPYERRGEVRAGAAQGTDVYRAWTPPSGFGAALTVGGGFTNFLGDTARARTDAGGQWDLRLALGTRSPLALEVGYAGGAQALSLPGLDPDAFLLRTGVDTALRFNLRTTVGGALFAPFVFGGVGWTRFSIANDSFNQSAVQDQDDVLSLPAGAGLAFGRGGFFADTRFTYRATFEENLFGNADLRSWSLGANIGAEF